MHKLPAAVTTLLLACLAGCGDRATPDADPVAPQATEPAASPPPMDDEHVVRRFDCQADTGVVLLDDGSARVSLPGGERHPLARVAGSEPAVYTGDSLYFSIGQDAAHLSQQDGMRELACTPAD